MRCLALNLFIEFGVPFAFLRSQGPRVCNDHKLSDSVPTTIPPTVQHAVEDHYSYEWAACQLRAFVESVVDSITCLACALHGQVAWQGGCKVWI